MPLPLTCAVKSPRLKGAFSRIFYGRIRWKSDWTTPKLAPDAMRAMYGLGAYLASAAWSRRCSSWSRSGPRRSTAAPLPRHAHEGRPRGGRDRAADLRADAWRETPFFTDRERAALAWAEAVTRIGDGVSDALFAEARRQFTEKELVDLTWAVAAINGWNRVAISFRSVPGAYQPKNQDVEDYPGVT